MAKLTEDAPKDYADGPIPSGSYTSVSVSHALPKIVSNSFSESLLYQFPSANEEIQSTLIIEDHYIYLPIRPPNAWRRFWLWALAGISWE